MSLQDFQLHVLPLKDRLFRFALRMMDNAPEAEDLVQEVFIKLWKSRDKLDHIDNLEAWTIRITKNMAIDRLRRKDRHTEEIQDGLPLATDYADPAQQTETHDTMDLVQQLMQDLPPKQQQVMYLRDVEGLTYQEIAEALELELNQVKVTLHRARKRMQAWLLKTDLLER